MAMSVSTAGKRYCSPEGRHRHRCPKCRCVWEHDDKMKGVRGAHFCPACDTPLPEGCWWQYAGPDPPAHHDPMHYETGGDGENE